MYKVEIVQESDAGEKLSGKTLYLSAGKWHKAISFQEVEHTLSQEVGDYTNMIPEVESVS